MFVNTNKRQSNIVMSKRSHEEREERDTYFNNNNNNNNYRHNNNVNKRSKIINNSFNNLNASQEVMNVQLTDTGDPDFFGDGLDTILSQIVDTTQMFGHSSALNNNQTLSRPLDQNMSSVSTTTLLRSSSDISMNTNLSHQSSNESDISAKDLSEGRIGILESKTKHLNEELIRSRTQIIQTQNKLNVTKSECEQQMLRLQHNFETKLQFEENENRLQAHLIEQLQTTLKKIAPNAPILQSVDDYWKQKKVCQTFSQIKTKEFYAPLTSTISSTVTSNMSGSHSSQFISGEVLAPESQSSVGGRRAQNMSSYPSEIGSTQFPSNDCSMPSVPQSMDTTSVILSDETIKENESTQNASQSQNLKIIWNSIRPVLEHKFNTDVQQLRQYYFGQQIELFDDQWLNITQELNDWTQTLIELDLALDLKLNIQ